MTYHSRGAFRPGFASLLGPLRMPRAQGRPGERTHPWALAQKNCAKARRPQVSAASRRPSLHSGLQLIRVLLGEPAFATVADHNALALSPTWRLHGRARTTRLRCPRNCRSSVGTIASTAFRSTFVTTRTPLVLRAERLRDYSDLQKLQRRRPATDWHDGQVARTSHAGGEYWSALLLQRDLQACRGTHFVFATRICFMLENLSR
jgi:hypothetical protein